MDSLRPHVLVLDPDRSVRVLLTAILRHNGLHVTTCDGEPGAAAQCFRRGPYAAVILASDMPGYGALLDEISAPDPQRPKIIVAATREQKPPDGDGDLVLMKPFHFSELQAAVRVLHR